MTKYRYEYEQLSNCSKSFLIRIKEKFQTLLMETKHRLTISLKKNLKHNMANAIRYRICCCKKNYKHNEDYHLRLIIWTMTGLFIFVRSTVYIVQILSDQLT